MVKLNPVSQEPSNILNSTLISMSHTPADTFHAARFS